MLYLDNYVAGSIDKLTLNNLKLKELIFLLFVLFQNHSHSQNLELNKQETVAQIEAIYKATYSFNQLKIVSVSLENNFLNIYFDKESPIQKTLFLNEWLSICKMSQGYIVHYASSILNSVLWAIQSEEDAKLLKNYLEHLIELVRLENTKCSVD